MVRRVAFVAAICASGVVAALVAGGAELTAELSVVLWISAAILLAEELFDGIRRSAGKRKRSIGQQRRRILGYSLLLILITALLLLNVLRNP